MHSNIGWARHGRTAVLYLLPLCIIGHEYSPFAGRRGSPTPIKGSSDPEDILFRYRRAWNEVQATQVFPRMDFDVIGLVWHERWRRIGACNLHSGQDFAVKKPVDRCRSFGRMQMPQYRGDSIAGDGTCNRQIIEDTIVVQSKDERQNVSQPCIRCKRPT